MFADLAVQDPSVPDGEYFFDYVKWNAHGDSQLLACIPWARFEEFKACEARRGRCSLLLSDSRNTSNPPSILNQYYLCEFSGTRKRKQQARQAEGVLGAIARKQMFETGKVRVSNLNRGTSKKSACCKYTLKVTRYTAHPDRAYLVLGNKGRHSNLEGLDPCHGPETGVMANDKSAETREHCLALIRHGVANAKIVQCACHLRPFCALASLRLDAIIDANDVCSPGQSYNRHSPYHHILTLLPQLLLFVKVLWSWNAAVHERLAEQNGLLGVGASALPQNLLQTAATRADAAIDGVYLNNLRRQDNRAKYQLHDDEGMSVQMRVCSSNTVGT